MSETLAGWIVWAFLGYAGIGLVFAVPFVWLGVNRIDPVARDSSRGFRIMILPGSAALWPILLLRWIRGAPPPNERNAHRDAAGKR